METVQYNGYDCVRLTNERLEVLMTRSLGPRVLSLRFAGGENLFAELPNVVATLPDGRKFHFHGGHRLWHAPEHMPRTYGLDNAPVMITPITHGIKAMQPVEAETGIQKTMRLALKPDADEVTVTHVLTNKGLWPVECAPWAITQFKPGGVAILPQATHNTGLLPNRMLALWPYTDTSSPHVTWGRKYVFVRAQMQESFKVGFPNPRGWLAYWREGVLFVKFAEFQPQARYYDMGSSSECYCETAFLELETLAPVSVLQPGESASHVERWQVFSVPQCPQTEDDVDAMAAELKLP